MSMIELDDMSDVTSAGLRKHKLDEVSTNNRAHKDTGTNDTTDDLAFHGTIHTWSYVAAGWIVIFSISFLAFPRFILFLSSPTGGEHRESLTPLEKFLSIHFSILAMTLAIGLLLSASDSQSIIERPNSKPHNPLVLPLTSAFLFSSFLAYNTGADQIGPLALLTALGMGFAGLWGLYTLMFTGSSISRKTGADKRTSRFIFWNQSSASAQKKRWRKSRAT